MLTLPTISLFALLGLFGPGGATSTDVTQEEQSVEQQLQQILHELQSVRNENTALREEVDELREEVGVPWLTERRVEEIKALVQDVLADADTRATLQDSGIMAGWSEHFFLASVDGRFKLQIGGLLQQRWVGSHVDNPDAGAPDRWRSGFESSRTQLVMRGHLFGKNNEFFMRMGYGYIDPFHVSSDDVRMGYRLWDAFIRTRINDSWSIRVGTFKLPFSRESLIPDGYQQAVERSLTDAHMGMGRSTGIEAAYLSSGMRGRIAFSNGTVALFSNLDLANTETAPPWSWAREDTDWALTGRIEWLISGHWEQFNQMTSPPGSEYGVMFGIGGMAQQQEHETPSGGSGPTDPTLLALTTDLSIAWGGANLFGSFYYGYEKSLAGSIDELHWLGYVIQGGLYLTPKTEIYSRFAAGGPFDADGSGISMADFYIWTVGMNYYLDGQDLKVTTDFGYNFGSTTDVTSKTWTGWRTDDHKGGQWLLRAQLQLMF
jgi:regulator of replication initiation timing